MVYGEAQSFLRIDVLKLAEVLLYTVTHAFVMKAEE